MTNGEYRIDGYNGYSIRNFKDGEFHGLSTFFIKNSRGKYVKVREEDYKNGKLHGLIVVYRQNGDAWKITDCSDDTENGRYIEYHSHGLVKIIGHYTKGKKCGKWIGYNKTGEIKTKECYYENGKLSGEYITRDEWGNVKKCCSYDECGRLHGKVVEYHNPASGFLQKEFYYENGSKVGLQKSYDCDGNLMIEENYIKMHDGVSWEYNKVLTAKSFRHGNYFKYDSEENIIDIGKYKNGHKDGIWIQNYKHEDETAKYYNNGTIVTKYITLFEMKNKNRTIYDAFQSNDLTLIKELCKINRYRLVLMRFFEEL